MNESSINSQRYSCINNIKIIVIEQILWKFRKFIISHESLEVSRKNSVELCQKNIETGEQSIVSIPALPGSLPSMHKFLAAHSDKVFVQQDWNFPSHEDSMGCQHLFRVGFSILRSSKWEQLDKKMYELVHETKKSPEVGKSN